jgi:hypothetical protein
VSIFNKGLFLLHFQCELQIPKGFRMSQFLSLE